MRGRLVADDAAQRRRNAAGAAGIGAERAAAMPSVDRDRGARRRAARNAAGLAVVRVARRAVMRVDAEAGERELGHVGAADRDEAGGAQARHRGASRVAGGAWRSAVEPAVVTSPATSNKSLIEIGIPANTDGVAPRARSAS